MSPAREMGQGHGTLSAAAVMVCGARQDFDRLDQELTEHLARARSLWGGQGSAQFQALGLAWSERRRTIAAALDRFEDALRSTERDNTATDEAQSAAFVQARHRLG
jgi:uncharacterized protein YukE